MLLADLRTSLTRHVAWLRRAAWLVLVAGVASFLLRGADNPADPHVERAARKPLAGFSAASIRVTQPSGDFLEWCALLAASEAAREQGLMGQTDLRGYDAMAFRFEQPSSDAFYMFHTVLPLSIAWFDADGHYVSQSDMPPCHSTTADGCPVFRAARRYTTALEVPRGGLARLGVRAGVTLSFAGAGCS